MFFMQDFLCRSKPWTLDLEGSESQVVQFSDQQRMSRSGFDLEGYLSAGTTANEGSFLPSSLPNP